MQLYHIVNTKKGYISSWDKNDNLEFTHDPEEAILFPLDIMESKYIKTGEVLRDKYDCLTYEFVIHSYLI
jgi:hypothetical protein